MNSYKVTKAFCFLLENGYAPKVALKEAYRIASKSDAVGIKIAKKTAFKTHKDTVAPTFTLSERIVGYANTRKGHEWSLASCALTLGVDPNSISAQLTKLTKKGTLVRIGRGKYRTHH